MEFENSEYGKCELMKCDTPAGKTLIHIKNNSTNPYAVTTNLLKDFNWVKANFFPTYEEALKYYDSM